MIPSSARKARKATSKSPPASDLRRQAMKHDRQTASSNDDEIILRHSPSKPPKARKLQPSGFSKEEESVLHTSDAPVDMRQTLPENTSSSYALARQTAVHKLSFLLVSQHRAQEGHALQQLYAESFKKKDSRELLDVLLRSGLDQGHDETVKEGQSVERLTVKQQKAWERFLNKMKLSESDAEGSSRHSMVGVVVPTMGRIEASSNTANEGVADKRSSNLDRASSTERTQQWLGKRQRAEPRLDSDLDSTQEPAPTTRSPSNAVTHDTGAVREEESSLRSTSESPSHTRKKVKFVEPVATPGKDAALLEESFGTQFADPASTQQVKLPFRATEESVMPNLFREPDYSTIAVGGHRKRAPTSTPASSQTIQLQTPDHEASDLDPQAMASVDTRPPAFESQSSASDPPTKPATIADATTTASSEAIQKERKRLKAMRKARRRQEKAAQGLLPPKKAGSKLRDLRAGSNDTTASTLKPNSNTASRPQPRIPTLTSLTASEIAIRTTQRTLERRERRALAITAPQAAKTTANPRSRTSRSQAQPSRESRPSITKFTEMRTMEEKKVARAARRAHLRLERRVRMAPEKIAAKELRKNQKRRVRTEGKRKREADAMAEVVGGASIVVNDTT